MSANTQLLIVFLIVACEIIGIIIYVVMSSDWLGEKFSDSIENATVHIWNGKGYKPFKAKLISIEDGWYKYRYVAYHVERFANLPPDYPIQYEKRKRIIYGQLGTSYPLDLPGQVGIKWCESDVAKKMHIDATIAAYKAIKKNGLQISGLMIIIAIIAIVAIGGGLYWYVNHNKTAKAPVITPITTPTKKIGYSIGGYTLG